MFRVTWTNSEFKTFKRGQNDLNLFSCCGEIGQITQVLDYLGSIPWDWEEVQLMLLIQKFPPLVYDWLTDLGCTGLSEENGEWSRTIQQEWFSIS